jgi:hypothetical protein
MSTETISDHLRPSESPPPIALLDGVPVVHLSACSATHWAVILLHPEPADLRPGEPIVI